MILSLASVILVIIRIGIGLGMEFAEKKEIREMRKKIDDTLKNEWIGKLQSFLVARADYPKMRERGAVDDKKITKEIVELGEATRYTQIASTLLKVLSKMIFDIVKAVILIVVLSIVFAVTIWASITFPTVEFGDWRGFLLIEILILGASFLWTRKRIKGYIFLRSQFYDLAEKPELSKAEEIGKELERRELIYV